MFDLFVVNSAGKEEKLTLYSVHDFELAMNLAKDFFDVRGWTVEVRDEKSVRGRISLMEYEGEKRTYIQIWETWVDR